MTGGLCDCGDLIPHHDRAGCANPTCSCRRPGPGGASEWTLVIDTCGPVLVTNRAEKLHWRARSLAREAWRDAACVLARAWRIPKGLPSIHVTCWPRQPNQRAMPDCDAPAPALKGALDGLVLAGIIADDKPPFVASVLYLPAVVVPGEPPALIVRVAAGDGGNG